MSDEIIGKTGNANIIPEGAPKATMSAEQIESLTENLTKAEQRSAEFQKFFDDIAPLLGKLDQSPEIVQAILDGKIDQTVAKAALEGKITFADAAAVTKAHDEVKKDLGSKGYKNATQEDIEKLVAEKVSEVRSEFEKKFSDDQDLRSFEQNVQDFISRTADFADYAQEIDKWLDSHDTTDLETAYWAVKGQLSEKEARKRIEEEGGEFQKNIALNAGGGSSNSRGIVNNPDIIDSLIGGRSNPNVF